MLTSRKFVVHLITIKKSMYPKSSTMNKIYGMNSKKKSIHFLKYTEFNPFIKIPMHIYNTARITANFILKLFEFVNPLLALPQIGSMPIVFYISNSSFNNQFHFIHSSLYYFITWINKNSPDFIIVIFMLTKRIHTICSRDGGRYYRSRWLW